VKLTGLSRWLREITATAYGEMLYNISPYAAVISGAIPEIGTIRN